MDLNISWKANHMGKQIIWLITNSIIKGGIQKNAYIKTRRRTTKRQEEEEQQQDNKKKKLPNWYSDHHCKDTEKIVEKLCHYIEILMEDAGLETINELKAAILDSQE